MNYTNTIQKKQSWIVRVFNYIFRWRDPEEEAKDNYRERIFDRYRNQ